jgi:hypothetical protein
MNGVNSDGKKLIDDLVASGFVDADVALAAGFVAIPATPEVLSVEALNASQFKVVFNREVEKYSAENEANYYVDGSALDATSLAKLQADKKSVIVTVSSAFQNDLSYAIKVDGVLDAVNTSVKVPKYIGTFLMSDKKVPGITKVTASAAVSTTEVNVEFDEPIAAVGGVVIENEAASVKTAQGTIASGNSNKVTITSNQALKAGETYTIKFNSVSDRAYPANTATAFAPVTASFTVVSDTSGPTVVGLTQSGDNKIDVEFSEDVNATTGVFVLDAMGLASGTITATGAAHADKKNVIVLTLTNLTYPAGNSRAVYVDVKGVKDTSGNMMADSLDNVITMIKDTTKPVYESSTLDSATNKKILVKFNEDLLAAAPAMTNYTIVDKDGVDVSTTYLTGGSSRVLKADRLTPGNGPYLEINLVSALPAGTYTLTIKSDAVSDASTAQNKVNAVSFAVTAGGITDTAAFTATIANTGTPNVITVTYSKEVKGGAVAGSATDPNNYMLGATALPAGTTITLNAAKNVATITLSNGTISATKSETLTVYGVQSIGGGTVTTAATTVVVTDNSKPTLVKAEAVSPTKIELTYSENVAVAAGLAAGDFVVSNGLTYNNQSATNATATGKVVTLTVPSMSAANQDYLKITILANKITDVAGNGADKVTDFVVADKFVSPLVFTLADGDTTESGINGLDLTPTYTLPGDTDVKEYKLYVFLTAGAPTITKVSDLDPYANVWKGATLPTTATGNFGATNVMTRSDGTALTADEHTVYIVTTDNNGNSSVSAPVTVTFTSE